ncbi:MAG: hypothetical protein EON56_05085 [Alphaproteobacteria bacterium]|nr:MAG: hypothetical protein EON56_05085 [Alphaproteobacteria bacterium]
MKKSLARSSVFSALLAIVLLVSQSAEDRRLTDLRSELALAAQELDTAEDTCAHRTADVEAAVGKRQLGEWDLAAAGNLNNISSEQEHEIRAALGRQMGLAPSQVDGWKDIYRARAENAAKQAPAVERQVEAAQKEAGVVCEWRDRSKSNVARLQTAIREAEKAARRQG